MADIIIEKLNSTFCKVKCDKSIAYELSDNFSFKIENWMHHPLVKNKQWDGIIRLYNLKSRELYVGLIPNVIELAKDYGYSIEIDEFYKPEKILNDENINEIVKSFNIPDNKYPREYQLNYFKSAINKKRRLCIAPTGSGKSLICYLMIRHLLNTTNHKILIIVPLASLVNQYFNDFIEYGFDSEKNIALSSDDNIDWKFTHKRIVISTWQSLQYMAVNKPIGKKKINRYDPEWFKKFGVLIGDEVHTFNAKALKNIADSLINAEYRIGLTGTLDGSLTNELCLTGMFGKKIQYKHTHELIKDGVLSNFKINILKLNYPDEFKKSWHTKKSNGKIKKITYQEEIDFIVQNERRNKFIAKLAISRPTNTLLMFRYVTKQGKPLYDLIKKMLEENGSKRNVYFYSGEEGIEERERIRNIVEKENDAIIIGSIGAISTGINIVNLHHLIFASPSKARIKTLQSIGRVLRKTETTAILYDIADDITYKTKENYTFLHLKERMKMYISEKFKYKFTELDLF